MRVHHLAFRTADIGRLEHFYANVLGLTVLRRDEPRSVWLDAAGTIVMLERRDEAEPALDRASKELVCFAIAPEQQVAVRTRLESEGITIEGHTTSTLYFRDPDGRRVGVSSYPDVLA